MIYHKIGKTFLSFFFSLFFASVVIFVCTEILPGDVAQFVLGINADAENLQTLRKELGLDLAWYQRYFLWIANLLQGNLGKSYILGEQNITLLQERLALSFPLILASLLISILLSHVIGLVSFFFQKKALQKMVVGFLQIGIALPSFWIATLLIVFFAVKKNWLPVGNFPGWDFHSWKAIGHSLQYLVLPICSLIIPQTAIFTRVVISSLKNTESEYFIKMALSKGLSKSRILFFHILPYSQIPIITIVALQIPFLLTGAILIENVFYLPGVGRLILQAIYQRDLILVKNAVLLLFVFVIFVQFLAKLLIILLNPEITQKQNL